MNAAERNILASKWRCSDRSIKRWLREGAPLSDDARMSSWLACRKNVPAGYKATVGTGVLERAILMRRQGLFTATQVVEMGNSVDLQIVRSVEKLHAIAGELVGKSQEEIEARLLQAEQEILGSCLCQITNRIELV